MGEPRRVMHVIDTGGPGGAETVLDTIVAGLPRESWLSRIIVPSRDWLSDRLQHHGVDVAVVPPGGAVDIPYLRSLRRELGVFRPAVVHAHLLVPGVYGTLAASLTCRDTPLVCTFHGRPDVSVSDRLLRLKGRIMSRRRNRIAYVSHDLRAYLEPLLALPPRSGTVIHNGIPFSEGERDEAKRRECGARPGDILVGAVGNIRPAKDYANLLRAAAIVCRARADVSFAIAGDCEAGDLEHLTRLAEDLGVSGRVRFLGFRSDAADLVTSFDLFVSSSYTEGLPLATVEAVGLGTPVVLTDCGGVSEVVDSGRTGLLVPPRDAEALGRGILQAIDNPIHAADMARVGSRDVRLRFSAERMCDAYQALYRQLVSLA